MSSITSGVIDDTDVVTMRGVRDGTVLTDGRLGTAPHQGLVDHVNAVELGDETAAADEYVQIDLAHVLMLTRQGVFQREQGRAIAGALLRLLDDDPQQRLAGDPAVGTILLQVESYLEHECGPAGADLQRARSRIDQRSTGIRMANRRAALTVLVALLDLAHVLLDAAARHDTVLAPGYTHLQHAQPTTLGHYFNAHYWNVSRNLGRMIDMLVRLDECPLGGAAHSGTEWPIDRALTAGYLGFARPVRNARDAGSSAFDGGAELACVLGLTLAGVSRLAGDLFYWSSSEVGLVRLSAALCGTSSMMPQKRNPIALERIRGLAGESAGWGASLLAILHSATSTDVDQAYVHNRVPAYCGETAGAVGLMGEAVRSLEVDVAALARSAGRHWSTASALADELVRRDGLSFRAAHELVARFIAAHERAGITDEVRPDLAEGALRQYSTAQIGEILDVRTFVEARDSAGGTAARRRHELAVAAQEDLATHVRTVEALTAAIEAGRSRLLKDAADLVGERAA